MDELEKEKLKAILYEIILAIKDGNIDLEYIVQMLDEL